jgi:hypothetical protein
MSPGTPSHKSSESITLGAVPSAPESKPSAPVTTRGPGARARIAGAPAAARKHHLPELAEPAWLALAGVAAPVQVPVRSATPPGRPGDTCNQIRANPPPWLPSHRIAYMRASSGLVSRVECQLDSVPHPAWHISPAHPPAQLVPAIPNAWRPALRPAIPCAQPAHR